MKWNCAKNLSMIGPEFSNQSGSELLLSGTIHEIYLQILRSKKQSEPKKKPQTLACSGLSSLRLEEVILLLRSYLLQ